MPTYEYVCHKCGHEFETVQSMKDASLSVCPEDLCRQKRWGRGKVQRKIGGGAGIIFKGSGFYITDYRSEGYKQAAKKDSEAAKPASTSSTDSKPAAKSDSKPAKDATKK